MSALWTNPSLSSPTPDGGPRWIFPFDDEFSQIMYQQDYIQLNSAVTTAQSGAASDGGGGFVLVGRSEMSSLGGGIVKWTDTYATVPNSRQIYEGYSWLVPGIGSGAIFTPQVITSAVNTAGGTTITCAGDTSAAVGGQVSIYYTFTDSATGIQYGRTVIRTVLSGGGPVLGVDLISEPGGTLYFLTARNVEPGRPAEALEVASMVQLDYFQPGTAGGLESAADIPIIMELQIYNGDGVKVNSFAADTVPTVEEWREMVADREQVCVVSSIIRKWYGPIFERATRYCVAR